MSDAACIRQLIRSITDVITCLMSCERQSDRQHTRVTDVNANFSIIILNVYDNCEMYTYMVIYSITINDHNCVSVIMSS